MKNYEVLYIIDSSVADDATRDALIAKFEGVVTNNGGSVEKVDKWGVKKFAYPIDYKTEGFYVLMTFSAEAGVPAELDRNMRITDEIVRQMIVCK